MVKLLRSTIAISLLFAFLSSTVGIQLYKHYCGDYLAAVSLFHKSSCGEVESEEESCKMQKEKSCCEDEFHYLQLDTELANHIYQGLSFEQIAIAKTLFNDTFDLSLFIEGLEIEIHKDPPERHKLPLYKRLNRLTYYG
jgi:hypothetical protein